MEQNKIFTIKELTAYIKLVIDNHPVLSDIWIRGEISNFTHHSSGHMYFTLKDSTSRLRSIMFAGNNRQLKFIPKNGMKIIARGYISIFERDGQYQFYIQEMQPDGIGELYIAYEQLKQKLEEEGLFDPTTKKAIPPFPQTIGIITSATGAAIRDIITTIKRRFPYVNLLVYPVLVQGEGAAKSISQAIDQMNKQGNIDLLIVGRGGGSIEELWAFNEEIVARSIFYSIIPIISAVGHETDYTIADFVADVRAATPTAAAELAVPQVGELQTRLAFLESRLNKQVMKMLERSKTSYNQILKSIVFRRPKQQVLEKSQRLDRLEDSLRLALNKYTSVHKEKYNILYQKLIQEKPNQKVQNYRDRLHSLKKQLFKEVTGIKGIKQNKLDLNLSKLDALSPLKVMQRGYGIPFDEGEKKLIRSVKAVQLGDIIKLHLVDGRLDCQVWSMEEKKDGSN